MTLDELLRNPKALPTAPRVLEELISSFDDPDVEVDRITRTLSTDPVLSAKLLRLANSAYYHVPRRIGTVDEAVRMLGFVTVRTLVISSGLVNGFNTAPGLDLRHFWRYSLHTAVSARWIAQHVGENADLAFTIGLMHAIGQVILHAGMPEQATRLDAGGDPYDPGRIERENAALGFNFSDAGAGLARAWRFPEVFISTIQEFPDPARSQKPDRLACVIHLAAWRARTVSTATARTNSPPAAVAFSAGVSLDEIINKMPTPAELSAGLEDLIT